MTLEFKNVSKVVNGEVHIHPTDLTLERGTMNVLAGADVVGENLVDAADGRSGCAHHGPRVLGRQDVTGMRVQDRKVAMVYQQFINYPSMTVYDNIASPDAADGQIKG